MRLITKAKRQSFEAKKLLVEVALRRWSSTWYDAQRISSSSLGGPHDKTLPGSYSIHTTSRPSSSPMGVGLEGVYVTISLMEDQVSVILLRDRSSIRKIPRSCSRNIWNATESNRWGKRNYRRWWRCPAYCTVEPICKPNIVSTESAGEVEPFPTTREMIDAQANDTPCQKTKDLLKVDRTLTCNEDRLFTEKAPTDKALQIIFFKRYRRTELHYGHCPTFAGHPGAGRMYGVLRRTYCWTHVAPDVA